MRRSTSARAAVAAASALTLLAGGVALADVVDIAPEKIGVEAGKTGTLDVVLKASDDKVQGADDVKGCNASTGAPVRVALTASPNKSWVTVSPSTLTFTGCGVPQRVTVAVAEHAPVGETTHVTGTATGGRTETVIVKPATAKKDAETREVTSQFADDKVNVTVLNTPPSVAVTGVDSDSYEFGSEPSPGCLVSDINEPGASAPPSVDLSAQAHGLGPVNVSCAFTDAHGASAGDTASYRVVDTGVPTITASLDRTAAATGWFNLSTGAPLARFDCADAGGSGIASCTGDTGLDEGKGLTVEGTAVDHAGNQANAVAGPADVDLTSPALSAAVRNLPNAAGWYRTPVTVGYTASDALSGVTAPGDDVVAAEGSAVASAPVTVTDFAGNESAPAGVTGLKIDRTAPTLTAAPTTDPNAAGWYRDDVTVRYTATDDLSGVTTPADVVVAGEGAALASAPTTVTDVAGNESAPAGVTGLRIDRTAPTVALVGGPGAGSSHLFGDTPAAPTCTADDALSGLAGACTVSGYGTTVGTHTLTATATDRAGNTSTASARYTVKPWTVKGFSAPVDMGGVVNTVKGGSTVPLKFEVFKGTQELSATSAIGATLARKTTCGTGAQDAVELTATGGTSLRYDATGGQFVFNWQSPATPGACYAVSVTTADGSSQTASFLLK